MANKILSNVGWYQDGAVKRVLYSAETDAGFRFFSYQKDQKWYYLPLSALRSYISSNAAYVDATVAYAKYADVANSTTSPVSWLKSGTTTNEVEFSNSNASLVDAYTNQPTFALKGDGISYTLEQLKGTPDLVPVSLTGASSTGLDSIMAFADQYKWYLIALAVLLAYIYRVELGLAKKTNRSKSRKRKSSFF